MGQLLNFPALPRKNHSEKTGGVDLSLNRLRVFHVDSSCVDDMSTLRKRILGLAEVATYASLQRPRFALCFMLLWEYWDFSCWDLKGRAACVWEDVPKRSKKQVYCIVTP